MGYLNPKWNSFEVFWSSSKHKTSSLKPEGFLSPPLKIHDTEFWGCKKFIKIYGKQSIWIKWFNPSPLKRHNRFTWWRFLRLSFTYKHWSTHIKHIKYGKQKLKRVCVKHKNQRGLFSHLKLSFCWAYLMCSARWSMFMCEWKPKSNLFAIQSEHVDRLCLQSFNIFF